MATVMPNADGLPSRARERNEQGDTGRERGEAPDR